MDRNVDSVKTSWSGTLEFLHHSTPSKTGVVGSMGECLFIKQ